MSIQYTAIALKTAPGYNRYNTQLATIKSIK